MSPGLIRNEDVAYVRENVRIDEVIGDYEIGRAHV